MIEKRGNSQFQEIQKQLSKDISEINFGPSSPIRPRRTTLRPILPFISTISTIPPNVIQHDSEMEQKFDKKLNNLIGNSNLVRKVVICS